MKISIHKTSTFKWIITCIIPLIILLVPITKEFTVEIKYFFMASIFIMSIWATGILPLLIPSLMLPIIYFLLKLAPPSSVFAPWSTQLPWLFLSAMILANILERIGLMKRIACWSILKAGGGYKGIIYGFFFSGILVSLLVPSGAGKVALYATLAYGICKELKISPDSEVSALIMTGGYFSAIGPLFLTGGGNNIIAFETVAKYGGGQVTWLDYFIQMGLPSILFTFILVSGLLFIFKKDSDIFSESNHEKTISYFRNEYLNLGELKIEEIKVAIILGVVVLGLLTGNIHKIAPGWIFVLGCCACFFPGINIGNNDDINAIKFPMIIFMTSAMCIGNVSIATGAGNFVANHLYTLLHGNIFSVTGFVWLFGVLVNFVLTPLAAVAGLTTPLLESGIKAGHNPLPILYTFLQGVEQILLPYENATVLFLYGYGLITMKNFLKAFGFRMVLNLIFLLVVCVPYWSILGLFK